MFILYFALWVILNGKWTLEIGAFGVVFAAVAYLFSCKFMGYSMGIDLALLKRAPAAIRYGFVLLGEIVKANIAVIRMILDKGFEPKPQLVHFDAKLERGRHLVTLANSITLTPGTITVNLTDNHFVVHCLDESLVEGLDDGVMVAALEAMESRHPVHGAAVGKEAAEAAEAVQAEEAMETNDGIDVIDQSEEQEGAQTGEEGASDDEH